MAPKPQSFLLLALLQVGVPLNGLVVWALGCRGQRHLVRRGSSGETRAANTFRTYVLNLAVADLVLLVRTPLMLGYVANNFSWPFGRVVCHLIMFLRGLGLYASAFLLCAVSLERCLCLLKPVWAGLRRPPWAVPLVCTVLWLVATGLSLPYLSSAVLMEMNLRYQCVQSGSFNTPLFVMETAMGFILPLLVFLGSNVAVLLKVKQAVPSTPSPSTSSARTSRKMTRLYQVLFVTMLFFLTCWVPYFVCRLLATLAQDRPERAALYKHALQGSYVSLFFVYIKSGLNPVLYVFAARGLSRAVKASLVSTIERLFSDDSVDSIRKKSLKGSLLNSRT